MTNPTRIKRAFQNGGIFPSHRWGIDWWWEGRIGGGKHYRLRLGPLRLTVWTRKANPS